MLATALILATNRAPAARAEGEDANRPQSGASSAVAEPPRRVIEEILVTAQKREQAAIDVPLSMSVLNDEFISREGITDLQQISTFVPNVNIRLSPVLPDIRIRGFGTGITNKAFEQSVGLVVDGIPYNRVSYYGAGVFDLERIEVLRGPQGTLFGKNTIAGLLNMIPKDPTDELSGSVDLQLGDYQRERVEAGVGGPLVKRFVDFRLAGLVDLRQGFVKNTTAEFVRDAHEFLEGYDRHQFRGRLKFSDLLGSQLKLSYDWFRIDAIGLGAEFKVIPQKTRPFFRQYDPNTDFEPGNFIASVDHPDGSLSEAHTVAANWHDDFGRWGVDFVAGHSILDLTADLDLDYSPAPAAVIKTGDDNSVTTVELRTTSPSLGGVLGLARLFGPELPGNSEFIAGVFYQRRLIRNSFLTVDIDPVVFGEFVVRQDLPATLPPFPIPAPGTGRFVERSTLHYNETSNSIAGFGQSDWHFLPRWTLTTGMRLQNETKAADWKRAFESPTHVTFSQFLNWEEFQRKLDRSEFQVSPKVSVNYKPIDALSLFARWSRGYKGGGFNEFATRGSVKDLSFDQEKVDEWALDAKTTLLDGAASLNVSLFWMDLKDFQVITTRPGDIVITVVNAAKARARGVEADLTWLPTRWLTLIGTLGFDDAKYIEFPIGGCPQDMPNTDGDADPRCDLSGHSLVRTPEWMITLTPLVVFPAQSVPGIGRLIPASWSGLGLTGDFTAEYQDSQDTEGLGGFGDPRARQPRFFRFRGSIGFGNLDQGWLFRLHAENITNQAIQNGTGEIQTAPGHIWQLPEPPRVIYGELRWAF